MTQATLGFAIDSTPASSAAVDLEKLTAAAVKTEKSVENLETAAKGLATSLGATGKGADGAKGPIDSLGRSFGAQDEHVRAFRAELDRLTEKFQPLSRATKAYEASVAEINRAHQLGVLNAQQMQKALDAERISYERLKTAATGAGQAVQAANQNMPGRSSAQNFNAANAGYQFQDIAVTAAMGMNPLMIGLQQGTQLASVIGSMERPVAGLATAFASLISPVSLITIGLTAGVAALIQYFSTWNSGSAEMNGGLREQDELIMKVAERWGDATPALREYVDQLQRGQEASQLEQAIVTRTSDEYQKIADRLTTFSDRYNDFVVVLTAASNATGSARTEISELGTAFLALQEKIASGKATIDDFEAARSAATKAAATQGAEELGVFRDGLNELTAATARARDELLRLQRDRAIALTSAYPSRGTYDGVIRDADQPIIDPEFPLPEIGPRIQRRPLIELEGLPGEVKDQAKEENVYKRAMEAARENVEQLQLQAKTAGETGLAADVLRFKLDLLQRAFKDGKEPVAEQTQEIEALTQAYKAAAEAAQQARFAADMAFQDRQTSRSSQEQQIASTLRGYGMADDLSSPAAARIRAQIREREFNTAIDQFSSNLSSNLIESGGNIGKAVGQTILAALQDTMQKQLTSIFSSLLKAALGGTGSDGGLGGAAGSVVAALGGKAANNNFGRAPVGAVTRSALPDIGATTDIGAYIAKAAAARGIDPSIALRVAKSEGGLNSWNMQSTYFKNGVQEPSFGPYQLYMGGGLGNAFQKQTGLDPRMAANGPAGVDFALDHASKNGWGAWYGAAKVGVGKWDGIGGGGTTATDAVNKLAEAAGSATKGLDTMAGGLGKIGQSLSTSFFPAAPSAPSGGGGGLFSWLGGIFGGNQNLSQYIGKVGLFANGTSYAPGGMAIVGERGPELVDLPQGSQVFNANKSAQMMAANSNRQDVPPKYDLHFYGGGGDEHMKRLVREGIAQADQTRNDSMRRGGFGQMQQAYASEKG